MKSIDFSLPPFVFAVQFRWGRERWWLHLPIEHLLSNVELYVCSLLLTPSSGWMWGWGVSCDQKYFQLSQVSIYYFFFFFVFILQITRVIETRPFFGFRKFIYWTFLWVNFERTIFTYSKKSDFIALILLTYSFLSKLLFGKLRLRRNRKETFLLQCEFSSSV